MMSGTFITEHKYGGFNAASQNSEYVLDSGIGKSLICVHSLVQVKDIQENDVSDSEGLPVGER